MPVVELKTDPVIHVSAGGTLRLSAFVSVSYHSKLIKNDVFKNNLI